MRTADRITLLYDLRSCGKILPAGTTLDVILDNESGARCVDAEGYIHIIGSGDYIPVTDEEAST